MSIAKVESGAIPIQIAAGSHDGWLSGIGGILGGILFVRALPWIAAKRQKQGLVIPGWTPRSTIPHILGVGQTSGLLSFELGCILLLIFINQGANDWHWIQAGLCIAGAQAFSIILTRTSIGVSSAYEEIARLILTTITAIPSVCNTFPSQHVQRPPRLAALSNRSIQFSIGISLGALLTGLFRPSLWEMVEQNEHGPIQTVLGSMILIFGARLAGGCVSGHCVSGIGVLSIASFWTAFGIAIGGIANEYLAQP